MRSECGAAKETLHSARGLDRGRQHLANLATCWGAFEPHRRRRGGIDSAPVVEWVVDNPKSQGPRVAGGLWRATKWEGTGRAGDPWSRRRTQPGAEPARDRDCARERESRMMRCLPPQIKSGCGPGRPPRAPRPPNPASIEVIITFSFLLFGRVDKPPAPARLIGQPPRRGGGTESHSQSQSRSLGRLRN